MNTRGKLPKKISDDELTDRALHVYCAFRDSCNGIRTDDATEVLTVLVTHCCNELSLATGGQVEPIDFLGAVADKSADLLAKMALANTSNEA